MSLGSAGSARPRSRPRDEAGSPRCLVGEEREGRQRRAAQAAARSTHEEVDEERARAPSSPRPRRRPGRVVAAACRPSRCERLQLPEAEPKVAAEAAPVAAGRLARAKSARPSMRSGALQLAQRRRARRRLRVGQRVIRLYLVKATRSSCTKSSGPRRRGRRRGAARAARSRVWASRTTAWKKRASQLREQVDDQLELQIGSRLAPAASASAPASRASSAEGARKRRRSAGTNSRSCRDDAGGGFSRRRCLASLAARFCRTLHGLASCGWAASWRGGGRG